MAGSVRLDHGQIAVMLRTRSGMVGRDIARRGRAVARRARITAPRKTGRLAGSIRSEVSVLRGVPVAQITATARHAAFVIQGTGLYGPRGRLIRKKRVMVFNAPDGKVFTNTSRGQHPNKFLENAVYAAV